MTCPTACEYQWSTRSVRGAGSTRPAAGDVGSRPAPGRPTLPRTPRVESDLRAPEIGDPALGDVRGHLPPSPILVVRAADRVEVQVGDPVDDAEDATLRSKIHPLGAPTPIPSRARPEGRRARSTRVRRPRRGRPRCRAPTGPSSGGRPVCGWLTCEPGAWAGCAMPRRAEEASSTSETTFPRTNSTSSSQSTTQRSDHPASASISFSWRDASPFPARASPAPGRAVARRAP